MNTQLAETPAEITLALDRYTDPEGMRGLLQRHLPGFAGGALRIDAVTVSKVRRNTSLHRNPCPMSVCYALDITEPATGRHGSQAFFAKVFRPGLAASYHAAHSQLPRTAPAFGPALVHLPALSLVTWAFPNDPVLPQLTTLLGPSATTVFPWAALGLAPGDVDSLSIDLLRYEPEERATLRYRTRPGADGVAHEVVVKTFRDGRAGDIFERFDYFARLAQSDARSPLVARPLAHDQATRTVWQAAASGAPWLPLVVGSLNAEEAASAIEGAARALATLHAAPLAPSAHALVRTAAHWMAESKRREQKIARALPPLAALAGTAAAAIVGGAERQTARPLSLIHGDFHPDQLWLHEGRIVLFDFDEFALGDPMEDVAEFVIKLEQAGAPEAIGAAFVDAYAVCAPERFDRRSLVWHLAVQSLLQASRAFVYQQPGWQGALERRLAASAARAAALVAQGTP